MRPRGTLAAVRRVVLAAIVLAAAAPASAGPRWLDQSCQVVRPAEPTPPPPPPRSSAEVWGRAQPIDGDEAAGYVAFTFDDGPEPATTPGILEALDRHRVPAAFFVVGRRFAGSTDRARRGADLVREVAARGHVVGNHTLAHERLTTTSPERTRATIADNAAAIGELLGDPPPLFRAPYGLVGNAGRAVLRRRGDTEVRWNIDPADYRRQAPEALRARVVESVLRQGGGVVVLHDTKAWTAAAVPGILADLEAANCHRLATGLAPILPVSLHYFVRDPDGTRRPIPDQVAARTRRYRRWLGERCAADGERRGSRELAIDKGERSD